MFLGNVTDPKPSMSSNYLLGFSREPVINSYSSQFLGFMEAGFLLNNMRFPHHRSLELDLVCKSGSSQRKGLKLSILVLLVGSMERSISVSKPKRCQGSSHKTTTCRQQILRGTLNLFTSGWDSSFSDMIETEKSTTCSCTYGSYPALSTMRAPTSELTSPS